MSNTNNTCSQCGGQKTVYFKVEPTYSNGFTPAVHAITNNTLNICTCPSPKEKHDGRIDDEYLIHYGEVYAKGLENCIGGIIIDDLLLNDTSDWHFRPSQALSLLAWLKQEEDALQQLAAKEEDQ